MKNNLTQTELRRLLCYNPLTGTWTWRISPSFGVRVGDVAGTIWRDRKGTKAYRRIKIRKYNYPAHRLAFLYIRGYWPRSQVDHWDENGLNNRWLNLRECTRSQNQANRGPNKNNKLGIKGVHKKKKSGKYQAKININGKTVSLGYYNTPQKAARAYQKAAKKYFGEFAKQCSRQP